MRARTYVGIVLLSFGAFACGLVTDGCGEPAAPVTAASNAGNAGAAADAGASAVAAANAANDANEAANAALAKLPKLSVVMQDPRALQAGARDRERAKDPGGAAKALEGAALAGKLDDRTMSNWTYVEGRLHLAANDPNQTRAAAPELDRAAEDEELAPYASLRASQAYARLGQFAEALKRAEAARGRTKLDDEELVALAEALAGTGDRAAAIPLWRATLAAHPHGSRWVDSALRLADALLDQMSNSAYDAHDAHEARDLATRVMTEAPKLADSLGAPTLRSRAIALETAHGEHDSPDLSPESMLRRAQAWLDSSDVAHALEAANVATKNVKMDTSSPLACKASILRAQAAAKAKGKDKALLAKLGDDPWGTAIAACEKEDSLVTALSSGAKASASSKRTNEALDRYARLEQLFSTHRLADDARYQSALLVQAEGDEAKAYDLFVSLADAYPNGDMKGEALFRAALIKIVRGDWEAAKAPLDRAVALDPHDRHWSSAERAMYFRARAAAETGDAEGAREGYRGVIAGAPLSFYMMQAYARLHAIDKDEAERALAAAVARDEGGVFPSHEHPELASLPFRRACRLLEVGEVEAAKREFAAIGGAALASAASSVNVASGSNGTGDAGAADAATLASVDAGLSISPDGVADPELTWIVAWLFDTSGSPELGHSYVRGKLTDFLAHYPVGSWRVPWEVAFPRAYGDIVLRESATRSIPPALTWGIMREESGFYADAKSGANAFGLMQLVPSTAHGLGKTMNLPTDDASLLKPEVSIALGARLLSQLRGQFAREPALAIAAYNAGGGAVGKWIGQRRGDDFDLFVERIPYDETRGYEKRVLASEAAYGYLYNRAAFDETVSLALKVE